MCDTDGLLGVEVSRAEKLLLCLSVVYSLKRPGGLVICSPLESFSKSPSYLILSPSLCRTQAGNWRDPVTGFPMLKLLLKWCSWN